MGKAKKEKHAIKLAARAARTPAVVSLPLKKNILELVPRMDTSRQTRVDQCSVGAYVALAMLENARGNEESFRQLLSRLALGRLIAFEYFADIDAAKMHLAIRILLHTVGKQEKSEQMYLDTNARDALAICLTTIDHMQLSITEDQYITAVYQFGIEESANVEFTYEAVHDVCWETYKFESGWTSPFNKEKQ